MRAHLIGLGGATFNVARTITKVFVSCVEEGHVDRKEAMQRLIMFTDKSNDFSPPELRHNL